MVTRVAVILPTGPARRLRDTDKNAMQKTIVRQPAATAPDDPSRPEQVDPLLWRLYRARGVGDPVELERELAALIPPDRMDGLAQAVDLLAAALHEGRRILVIGDFDADGATSCALAVLALRAFGHDAVDFLVPNRFEFGYGLTPEIVEHARAYRPDLIVTVDNGVSSVAGVAAARRLGWQVVVTDTTWPARCCRRHRRWSIPTCRATRFRPRHWPGWASSSTCCSGCAAGCARRAGSHVAPWRSRTWPTTWTWWHSARSRTSSRSTTTTASWSTRG
jgi:hypothetical protein